MSHGARCLLQSKAPSHTLDYKSRYHADTDTKIIIVALLLSNGKPLPENLQWDIVNT